MKTLVSKFYLLNPTGFGFRVIIRNYLRIHFKTDLRYQTFEHDFHINENQNIFNVINFNE